MTASITQTVTPNLSAAQKRPTNPATEAWKSFQTNSAGHELTVLHEQGLYRHIRMARPSSRAESWDIVTWPGHLATSGDIADGLTFSRDPDMIEFFAPEAIDHNYFSDGAPSIDFRYWAQKLQGDQRQGILAYKHENFIRFVTETLTERLEDGDTPDLTKEDVDRLISEVNDLARDEADARDWLDEHDDQFPDSWENSFKDYSVHFQMACYAISATAHAYLNRPGPSSQTQNEISS